jgi:oxaloacetate decarboxylase gamma subunit
MESISQILLLLVVGMVTVFAVLSLVVGTGNLLIRLVNRLEKDNQNQEKVTEAHTAVLAATVSIVTQGKAQIVKINKTK